MGTLSERDARKLLTSLQAIYAARTIEQFAHIAMREMLNLVPSDMAAYNEVDLTGREPFFNRTLPDVRTPELDAAFARHADQHPGVRRLVRFGDPGPGRVMELVTRREWRRTGMYNEMWRPLATDDQIVMFIAPPPRLAAASVSRGGRDYGDVDRDLLGALRPHLRVARETVAALARIQSRSEQLIDHLGGHVVVLDRSDAIRSATRGAMALVQRYFAAPLRPPSHLPEPLLLWQRAQRQLLAAGCDHALRILVATRPFGTLRTRAIFAPDETTLIFDHRTTPATTALADLPLTDRERQIVGCLADGATNASIAAALDISALTVKKHLEHIYEKLGVDSRAAAVARAFHGALLCMPLAMVMSALLDM